MRSAATAILAAFVALVLFSGCSLLPVALGGAGPVSATAFCAVAASNIPSPSQRARDRRPRAFANSSAIDQNGIQVEIESDATSYSCTQPITVTAHVSYVGDQASTDVGAEGGSPVQFGVREMDGPLQSFPDPTTGCTDVTLASGEIDAIPFFKSGQVPTVPPTDVAFFKAYYSDQALNLPVGTWEIFALGTYVPGGCDPAGKTTFNRVSVVVTITP